MSSLYEVGQKVTCTVIRRDSTLSWEGKIYKKSDTGDDGEVWEYWVTNAPSLVAGIPLLVWENEITLENSDRES